ncbi:MAG: thioesterase family protein [Nocardioidaceae bacterium]
MRDDMVLPPHVERVRDEWIDYNGHLNEAYYVLVFGHATDAVMDALGMDEAYRRRAGCSLFTVEAHIRYLDQVGPGADLEVRTWVTDASRKRLNLAHEMYVGDGLRATEDVVALHVDTVAGRTAPFPDGIAAEISRRTASASS